jgi:hypothetical protein
MIHVWYGIAVPANYSALLAPTLDATPKSDDTTISWLQTGVALEFKQ